MPEHQDDGPDDGERASVAGPGPLAAGELPDDVAWAIVDAAPDGIILADEDGAILLVNHQAEQLFGFDRGELLGRSVDELLPQRFRDVHRAHRTRYRVEPRTRAMGVGQTLFGRRQDGTEFPVEVSLSPMRTDAGLRIIAVARDVTARIAVESESRRVREILDATRDAVLIIDADTLGFIYANQGAVDQVGYSAEELQTMSILHIAPEFDRSTIRELLAALARGEQSSIMYTTVHRHRDGTDVPVEIILQATDLEDGRPRAYVQIVRDIASRLTEEARLREVEQGLRLMEDRDRIARELHDTVIQRLFAVGLTVQGVQTRTDPEVSDRLSVVVDELDATIREIRTVIFSLQNEAAAVVSGLRGEILRVIREERDVLGFEPRVQFDGVIDTAPEAVAEALLPTLREALSNVGRHAAATSALVVVTAGERLTLRVEDDGIGIPAEPPAGSGLRNLGRRATDLGGTFEVRASPEGGTVLEWSVPIVHEA